MKITELHEDNRPPNPSANPPLDAATLQAHETARDGAFQGFMAAREQTYQQFMEAFMELTPEDVAEFNSRHQQPPAPPVGPSPVNPGSSNSNNKKKEAKKSSVPKASHQQQDHNSDLEEEVLGEGDVVPSRLMRPESPGKLKMDNFVDDEQVFSSDDEGATSSGYQASFDPTPAKQKVENTKQSPELSTQAEAPKSQSVSPPQSPKATKATKDKASPKKTQEAVPNLREEFPDSEPVIEARIEPHLVSEDNEEEEEEELVYDPTQDKPNPGEVEDEVEMPRMTADRKKTTCLEFSVRAEEDSPKVESEKQPEGKEAAADSVEKFALDEDFDYDNVVLTPKYSQEEMAILKTLMK